MGSCIKELPLPKVCSDYFPISLLHLIQIGGWEYVVSSTLTQAGHISRITPQRPAAVISKRPKRCGRAKATDTHYAFVSVCTPKKSVCHPTCSRALPKFWGPTMTHPVLYFQELKTGHRNEISHASVTHQEQDHLTLQRRRGVRRDRWAAPTVH